MGSAVKYDPKKCLLWFLLGSESVGHNIPRALCVLYALSLSSLSLAQVLSNSVKQKRAEKAGKWSVPLPKVKPLADDEMFKVMQSGKRKGRKLITTCFAFPPFYSAPFYPFYPPLLVENVSERNHFAHPAPFPPTGLPGTPSWIHAYNLLTTSCPFHSEILEADGNQGHLCGRELHAEGAQVSREGDNEREGSRRVWRRDHRKTGGLSMGQGHARGGPKGLESERSDSFMRPND